MTTTTEVPFEPGSTDPEIVAGLAGALGRDLTPDDFLRSIVELAPGRTVRAAVMSLLVGAGGARLEEYLEPTMTLADALHWLRKVRDAPQEEPPGFAVRLRPLHESDLQPLYRAATDPASGFRWRFRGATVSPDDFMESLWAGTFAQFMVEGVEDGERYGLVTSYNAQPDLGHAYIAMYRCSLRRGRGEMMTGTYLFINHLFSSFPLRKLYAELPGYNEAELRVADIGPFRVEGTLMDHDYHDGHWWDRHIVSTWRDDWQAFVRDFEAATPTLRSPAPEHQPPNSPASPRPRSSPTPPPTPPRTSLTTVHHHRTATKTSQSRSVDRG